MRLHFLDIKPHLFHITFPPSSTIHTSSEFVFNILQFHGLTNLVRQSDNIENVDYVFFAVMASAGLALLLSVPNARMAITLGIPAVMVVKLIATKGTAAHLRKNGINSKVIWLISDKKQPDILSLIHI